MCPSFPYALQSTLELLDHCEQYSNHQLFVQSLETNADRRTPVIAQIFHSGKIKLIANSYQTLKNTF